MLGAVTLGPGAARAADDAPQVVDVGGHTQWITSLALSKDSKLLATGGGQTLLIRPGQVKLWGLAEGKVLADQAEAHRSAVWAVALSPDAKTLATASSDKTVKLWTIESAESGSTLKERAVLSAHTNWVTDVAFSPSGALLASASEDGTVRLWDAESGKEGAVLKGHGATVRRIAFSADGKLLASASHDKTAKLWNVETGAEVATLAGHGDAVWDVAIAADGRSLATASADGTVRLWNEGPTEELKGSYGWRDFAVLRGHTDWVAALALSPDGRSLASGGFDRRVILWDLEHREPQAKVEDLGSTVWDLAFTPEGSSLLFGTGSHVRDEKPAATLKRWVLRGPAPGAVAAAGSAPERFTGATSWLISLAVSRDGKLLAAGGGTSILIRPGEVRFWDYLSGKERAVLAEAHQSTVWAVDFSPDGRLLASAGKDKLVKVWDLSGADGSSEAKPREAMALQGHTSWVTDVSFSPDGALLASGSEDGTVRLWELATAKEKAVLSGHGATVRGVAFSPDGRLLASASFDKTVKVWELSSMAETASFQGHSEAVWAVAFSPDGSVLASGGADRLVKLWTLGPADGELKGAFGTRELGTLQGHKNWVTSLAFSPDGRKLATGSFDRRVRIWDFETQKAWAVSEDTTNTVWAVVFSPDGRNVVFASDRQADDEETVRTWAVPAEPQPEPPPPPEAEPPSEPKPPAEKSEAGEKAGGEERKL
jgi:WD40 repeat protein